MEISDPEFIFYAGSHWKVFDYKTAISTLLKTKNPEYIFKAGTMWKEFDYEKALRILESEVTSGETWRARTFENRKWRAELKKIWESRW